MKFIKKRLNKSSYIIPVFLSLVLSYSQAIASLSYYPTKDWRKTTPEQQGIKSNMLADMVEIIKKNDYGIDSIVIVRKGYMVMDAYFHPFSKEQKHIIHSCTKSVMSALVGIAIEKGYIRSVNQPIADFFQDKEIANMNDQKKSITLENLLMMASGLDCKDSYLYGWKGLIEMRDSPDWAGYVLGLPKGYLNVNFGACFLENNPSFATPSFSVIQIEPVEGASARVLIILLSLAVAS